ncbi:protein of unknown function [Gracilibacillus orientalis]|uniref:DUF4062 domain-containing protein n=1 Tax=Gracilibacillus orientalis TaxID=334253 RepID=A0A1I4QDM2_9BACI|nr:DUF4062 domain-containing protein [Gracilibacillus orientalis]SFM38139.1 protein of unknown function [Gracilibacillus orientalis]
MEKKLQVFVSSTFTDLQEERQAAVSSILNAGHIPAGMELFKAGDESQKETIKRWIEESDVYMLILGGRYGTIDEESGKSYTHWEYEYAGEKGLPRFAIVIDDKALDEKVKMHGQNVMERENYPLYIDFKTEVLNKTSKFFSDIKDIKLAVLESLKENERDTSLKGWVSGKDVGNYEAMLKENHELLKELSKLRTINDKLEEKLNKENEIEGYSYQDVKKYLMDTSIDFPSDFTEELAGKSMSLLDLFVTFKDVLAIGIQNQYGMDQEDKFVFFRVAPKLMAFNLVEKIKVAGKTYQRVQTSKTGLKFLSMYEMEDFKK